MTDTIQVTTDTDKPSPPIITNVNCTGTTQISRLMYVKLSKCLVKIIKVKDFVKTQSWLSNWPVFNEHHTTLLVNLQVEYFYEVK